MSQLQINECIFAINSRVQPDGCGSPILRFFQRDVRYGLPNSLDRSVDYRVLMENWCQAHLRRVNRKGRTTKDSFEIGEFVRVQNIQTKVWDTQGEITGTRVAANNRIVSYDLIILLMGDPLQGIENFYRKYTYLKLTSLEWKIPVMVLTSRTVLLIGEFHWQSRLGQVKPGLEVVIFMLKGEFHKAESKPGQVQ